MKATKKMMLSVAVSLIFSCVIGTPTHGENCQSSILSHKALVNIIISEFRLRGSNFEPNPINSRFDFKKMGCDYVVRITFLPERPGDFEIYRISPDGKIIEYTPGY